MDNLYQYLHDNGITTYELIIISMLIITLVSCIFMITDFAVFIRTINTFKLDDDNYELYLHKRHIQFKIFIRKLIQTVVLTVLTLILLGLTSILL